MEMRVVKRLIQNLKRKTYLQSTDCAVHRVSEYGSHHGIVPACVGFLHDKTAVVEDTIKGTSVNLRN